jgi:DNA (cytosine-5)-methyltransferase 1
LKIPIIDLFAGPGGLGEGFSSYTNASSSPFQIALSIEKDPVAHKTLKSRALFRQLKKNGNLEEFYKFIRSDESDLSEYLDGKSFKNEINKAELEARKLELGPDDDKIQILIRDNLKKEKNFVLIGGPPCQAYSLIGRSKLKSIKGLDFESDERHLLYKHYLDVIAEFKPAVFVMENVKGILSSKLNGEKVFGKILQDLRNPGLAVNGGNGQTLRYNIYSFTANENTYMPGFAEIESQDFIIKSENFGIPQERHRVILLGIRNDLGVDLHQNSILQESTPYSIEDAIKDLPKLRSRLSNSKENRESVGNDDFKNWKLVLSKLPGMLPNSLPEVNDEIENVTSRLNGRKYEYRFGGRFTLQKKEKEARGAGKFVKDNWDWFHDKEIGGVINHESRSHIASDLQRYLWCSVYAEVMGRSPRIHDFPEVLLPNHDNVKYGEKGHFPDRFKVQLRKKPSKTITSHISKDGHYFIHYDPNQCRSLTVREAARIQTFPDNYFFEGNRTQQYHQIGNAVPPLLARQLADTVFQIMKDL